MKVKFLCNFNPLKSRKNCSTPEKIQSISAKQSDFILKENQQKTEKINRKSFIPIQLECLMVIYIFVGDLRSKKFV